MNINIQDIIPVFKNECNFKIDKVDHLRLFYNQSRGSYEDQNNAVLIMHCIKKGYLTIKSYDLIMGQELKLKQDYFKNQENYNMFKSYKRERDVHSVSLAYVYENINKNVSVSIKKELDVENNIHSFPIAAIAPIYIEDVKMIIAKNSQYFYEFFTQLLVKESKLCVLSSCAYNWNTDAYIFEKTDEFYKEMDKLFDKVNVKIEEREESIRNKILDLNLCRRDLGN